MASVHISDAMFQFKYTITDHECGKGIEKRKEKRKNMKEMKLSELVNNMFTVLSLAP